MDTYCSVCGALVFKDYKDKCSRCEFMATAPTEAMIKDEIRAYHRALFTYAYMNPQHDKRCDVLRKRIQFGLDRLVELDLNK